MAWNWKSLADQVLGTALNFPMKALENELALREKQMPSQAKVVTTDATATVLAALAIPVNQTVTVSGIVSARRTGGAAGATNDGAGYRVEFVAKNTAGTAAVIGSVVTAIGESQAAWDVTVVASGADVQIKVAGAVNNTALWRYSGRSLSVSS